MQKKFTVAAAGAALALGGAAAVAVPALADSTPKPSPSASSASPAPGSPRGPERGFENRTEDRTARIKDELKGLVADGTITQAQADKVAATLAQAGPPAGAREHGRGGPGRGGPMGFGPEVKKGEETAAKAIGISEVKLREGLRSGKTLAELAKENGKTTDDVVKPLVAQARERIAQAVTDKKLTQEQADRLSRNLEQRIRGFVENGRPGGHGRGGPEWRDHDRRGDAGDGRAPSSRPSPSGAARGAAPSSVG